MPSARRLWELSLKVSMTIEKKNTKGDDTHHLSFGIMHSGRYIGQEKRPLSVSFKGLIFRCYRRFDIKNAHPIQSGNDSHHIANRQY